METNALIALLRRLGPSGVLVLLQKVGLRGIVVLGRAYLGPLADRATIRIENSERATPTVGGLKPADLAILGLALNKLVFEIGELALHNPDLDSNGKQPEFKLDDAGRAPAMSVAHVAAATKLWRTYSADRSAKKVEAKQVVAKAQIAAPRARLYAARGDIYASANRYAYSPPRIPSVPRGASMTTSTSSRGCSTCGGTHSTPVPQPTPTPSSCGCGGGCGCKQPTPTAPTKTYDSDQCPTFAISCETKSALRDCIKVALCDFLRSLSETLCPDGRFDVTRFDNSQTPEASKQLETDLINSVGQLACSFLHCVPDALCPPEEPTTPPTRAVDCLPCDYAVEVVR